MPIVAGWILGFGALWLPVAHQHGGQYYQPTLQTEQAYKQAKPKPKNLTAHPQAGG